MDTSGMPKMGESALILERSSVDMFRQMLFSSEVTNSPGTGIIVVNAISGRIFKIEIAQVGGPQ